MASAPFHFLSKQHLQFLHRLENRRKFWHKNQFWPAKEKEKSTAREVLIAGPTQSIHLATLSTQTSNPTPPVQPKRSLAVSVRELVHFVLRSGNLGSDRDFVSPTRALAGTRGHQRVQKTRPEGYETEVNVTHQIETEDLVLTIKGRIDGVLKTDGEILIEEIKTISGKWDHQTNPLHWAQGKIYAFLYALKFQTETISVQLTYLELENDNLTHYRERYTASELRDFFQGVIGVYMEWVGNRVTWCNQRDQSIQSLQFPYPHYRAGQRRLAVAVYRALVAGNRLFAEAPTGIGKTASVLFPAIKSLGEGRFSKLFYLTAKTIGRTVAEKSLAEMRHAGLKLRSVTLTAKEKICFNNGLPCDVKTCPFAIGYYDRVKAALKEALAVEELNRPAIEEIARRHQVCPFELSLDASFWADAIICDYNYVFDPTAFLRRYFSEVSEDYALLVDEAHNLVDRAREMFSADLEKAEILEVKRAVQDELPGCARALHRINALFLAIRKSEAIEIKDSEDISFARKEFPEGLLSVLERFQDEAESWLVQEFPAPFRQQLLDLYFRVAGFLRIAELYDSRFVTLFESFGSNTRLRLFCLDPSKLIQNALERGRAAVFFSATLTPIDYFREILGGAKEDAVLRLTSPFPQENLATLIQDRIGTSFKERAASFDAVATAIATVARGKKGNYLAYFPSYKYLDQVLERFTSLHPDIRTLVQFPGMTELERENFVAAFDEPHGETLCGFAVMGGVFGEGIDLTGDRLIGAIVVGVGLPQVCLERDLIRQYFEAEKGFGFNYAYVYPGINRVLQAVGRVIRTETDRGVILLIDTRFARTEYQELLPAWWSPRYVRSEEQIENEVRKFW